MAKAYPPHGPLFDALFELCRCALAVVVLADMSVAPVAGGRGRPNGVVTASETERPPGVDVLVARGS